MQSSKSIELRRPTGESTLRILIKTPQATSAQGARVNLRTIILKPLIPTRRSHLTLVSPDRALLRPANQAMPLTTKRISTSKMIQVTITMMIQNLIRIKLKHSDFRKYAVKRKRIRLRRVIQSQNTFNLTSLVVKEPQI